MLLLLLMQLLQKAKMSKPAEVRPAKTPKVRNGRKRINLALQGGGAHGAFTWAALDQLLEDDRFDIRGISGTSAGAINAIMLVDGLNRGGPEEARKRLPGFLRAGSGDGDPPVFQPAG